MTSANRTEETAYFLTIMGNLATAKAARDVEAIADSIADLEMIALHSEAPAVAERAAREFQIASDLLADMQAARFGCTDRAMVAIRCQEPANLN